MGRTRAALLVAAAQAVERYGVRRTTMGDVATIAGVAKATLYNHFRTKEDVLAGVVLSALDALADECEQVARTAGLAAALERAATVVGAHPALRRVVADEPALVRPLLAPEGAGRADAAVARVLRAAGVDPDLPGVELVRRWIGSFAWDGAAGSDVAAGAALLASALRPLPPA